MSRSNNDNRLFHMTNEADTRVGTPKNAGEMLVDYCI